MITSFLDDPWIAMQLCVHGNLKKFLEKSRRGFISADGSRKPEPTSDEVLVPSDNGVAQISMIQLIRWCLDISKALEFISSKQVSKIWQVYYLSSNSYQTNNTQRL